MGAPVERMPSDDPPESPLSLEDRRWLHDKYEKLGEEEGQLAATRTSYFATIGAVLVTGLVVVVSNLIGRPTMFVTAVSLLAAFGLLISTIWAVLLHRTTDAQNLWREAALRLEERAPPLPQTLRAPVSFRSGLTIDVDLSRPYQAHRARFSPDGPSSWLDRVNPWTLTELMPIAFIAIWAGALVGVWLWYLFSL